MRGGFTSFTEIDITLTLEEMRRLGKETLHGILKHVDRGFPPRDVEVKIGSLKKNLFVALECFPKRADFEHISRYEIIISPEAYDRLIRLGECGDRPDHFAKVMIYAEDYLQRSM